MFFFIHLFSFSLFFYSLDQRLFLGTIHWIAMPSALSLREICPDIDSDVVEYCTSLAASLAEDYRDAAEELPSALADVLIPLIEGNGGTSGAAAILVEAWACELTAGMHQIPPPTRAPEPVAAAAAPPTPPVEAPSIDPVALARRTKREARLARRAAAREAESSSSSEDEDSGKLGGHAAIDDLDDFSSAWEEVKASGEAWGGRGRGGRGVARQYACQSTATRDVIVDGVTLDFEGVSLLERSQLRFVAGRRYAIIGRNGVGKSTLLQRIARYRLPGFPRHLRVSLLEQELAPALLLSSTTTHEGETATVVTVTAEAYLGRAASARERKLRDVLEEGAGASASADVTAEEIAEEITFRDSEIERRYGPKAVRAMLIRLGFGSKKQHSRRGRVKTNIRPEFDAPVSTLSGGWRMRLALGAALLREPDVLLLDEPTNHLDLRGVQWLQSFLVDGDNASSASSGGFSSTRTDEMDAAPPTLVLVSHDRSFIEAVASDIVLFDDKRLTYFRGTLAEHEANEASRAAHANAQRDAAARQESAALASVAKARASKGGKGKGKKHSDDKRLKKAAQQVKKIERIGLHDARRGHRFKTNSLKKMDVNEIRIPEQVRAARRARREAFNLPTPCDGGCGDGAADDGGDGGGSAASSRTMATGRAKETLLSMTKVSVGWGDPATSPSLLTNVTVCLTRRARVAMVGANGAGKSTLLALITGELSPRQGTISNPNGTPRVALFNQHHLDALAPHLETECAASLLARELPRDEAGDPRSRLAKFGLTGDLAKVPIAHLSGGQKTRLALAIATASRPQLLLLDEPTNHLDMGALDGALLILLLAFRILPYH